MDLVLCSCFTASAVVVFIAAAARMEAAQDSLYESGMLQALYTVTLPLGCSSSAYIAAVWLEFLPAQVIRLPCSVLSLRMPERTAALAESCLRKHYPKKTKYLFQEVPRRNAPTLCSKNAHTSPTRCMFTLHGLLYIVRFWLALFAEQGSNRERETTQA